MRGAKPKVYPPDLVARVHELYEGGATQVEVAVATGLTQKVIWRLMQRHGLTARVAAKRDQSGAKNHSWKGDSAGYAACHLRVQELRGTPSTCEDCGTSDPAKKYEWASLTKNYSDPYDYKRLCASCHKRFDGIVRNLRGSR